MQGWEAIIKAFTKFLYRDVVFALGGSTIIIAILYAFQKIPAPGSSIAAYKYIVAAGVSYAIGYAVQDLFSILGLVRTRAAVAPNTFCKLLYRWFERAPELPHEDFKSEEYDKARHWLYQEDTPQRYRYNHERTESLKQVGTVFGPCFAISGIILLIGYFSCDKNGFDLGISVASFVLGVVLWSLGWLKVTQQAQYLLSYKQIAESETSKQE
jgi:hypothetical protein